jgi:adenylate cyclase
VTLGKTWAGRHVATGLPFVQEISKSGVLAYRSAKSFLTGEAWLEDSLVCLRFEGYLSGRPLCGYIYLNRSGTSDEYLYVNPDTARYFSIMK